MASYHATSVATAVCSAHGHRIAAVEDDGPNTLVPKSGLVLPKSTTKICVACGLSLKTILGRAEASGRKSKKEGQNADSD
jgi:hypothetical protein